MSVKRKEKRKRFGILTKLNNRIEKCTVFKEKSGNCCNKENAMEKNNKTGYNAHNMATPDIRV